MPPKPGGDVPSAVYVDCPDCAEETLHTVLKGMVGGRGAFVLDATVSCTQCKRVHHATVREAADRDVPVIVSEEGESVRTRITLPGDEALAVDDLLTVDELTVIVTSIESTEGRRVERARVDDVKTVWAKVYDQVRVRFSINLGHRTIAKDAAATPEDVFAVGEEYTFGRLRVTVHAIKVEGKMLRRGSAEAREIKRVFAKPTPPDRKPYRPPPEERARLARKRAEEDAAEEPDERGVRPRTRSSRAPPSRGGARSRPPPRRRGRPGTEPDEEEHE